MVLKYGGVLEYPACLSLTVRLMCSFVGNVVKWKRKYEESQEPFLWHVLVQDNGLNVSLTPEQSYTDNTDTQEHNQVEVFTSISLIYFLLVGNGIIAETPCLNMAKIQRYIVIGKGVECPRCGQPMQTREHNGLKDRQLNQPYYYKQWDCCMNRDCKTTLVMDEAFKVWNNNSKARSLKAIEERRGKSNFIKSIV